MLKKKETAFHGFINAGHEIFLLLISIALQTSVQDDS